MNMTKKILLFILASLFAITQGAWAEKTPQAIWCESNTTLYFINSETVYAEGGTYDGQTVTNVWSGNDVVASPPGNYPVFILLHVLVQGWSSMNLLPAYDLPHALVGFLIFLL